MATARQAEIGHVEHATVVGVAVTNLDDDEVVTLEGEAVVGHGDSGDRGRRDLPGPQLVPEDFADAYVKVHLFDRARGGHDPAAEPLGQHTSCEPVIT